MMSCFGGDCSVSRCWSQAKGIAFRLRGQDADTPIHVSNSLHRVAGTTLHWDRWSDLEPEMRHTLHEKWKRQQVTR